MKKLSTISLIVLIGTLLLSCQKEYFDYSYRIKNSSSWDSIIVTCYVTSTSSLKTDSTFILEKGKTFSLCSRLDVAGQSIWDIENSIKLYKIKNLTVTTTDNSFKTLDLSYRKYWEGPTLEEGYGVYELNFTDNLFTLKKQEDYEYIIKNELPDRLFSSFDTNELNNYSQNHKDTLLGMTSKTIAKVDIYSYLGDDLDIYKENKLSGLKNVKFKYQDRQKMLDLKRDTSFLKIYEDSCLIIIKQDFFE